MSKKALQEGLEDLLKHTKKSVEILEQLVKVSKKENKQKPAKVSSKANKKIAGKSK